MSKGRMTLLERRHLDLLVQNTNRVVVYSQFAQLDPAFSVEYLRVIIHGIRKKIHGNITSIKGVGYVYHREC